MTHSNNSEEPIFFKFYLQEGKCEDSGKFSMEFASHAYSALEFSVSYVRFLSVSGCGDDDLLLRASSSSRAVPLLSRSEPETTDLLPKSKGILENFNPVDRFEAPKICLVSICHLDFDMMQ